MAGDGRETACADGESTVVLRDNDVKVWRLPDGRLFGAACSSEDIERLRLALVNKQPPPKLEEINGLLVDLKGHMWLYEGNIWQRIWGKYFAIGSGSVFALGAMDAGASAVEAVRIGKKRDPYSGGKITSLKLKR